MMDGIVKRDIFSVLMGTPTSEMAIILVTAAVGTTVVAAVACVVRYHVQSLRRDSSMMVWDDMNVGFSVVSAYLGRDLGNTTTQYEITDAVEAPAFSSFLTPQTHSKKSPPPPPSP